MTSSPIKSVAVIGAGAAGAAAAVALSAEDAFDVIRVFERREVPGGTWIYDADPKTPIVLHPGKLPTETDPPLKTPARLPTTTPPSPQYRYDRTPIYADLTTNVPAIAMSFSDRPFAYGPFVPHWIPKQYIENYFSFHQADKHLSLNTTVEDVSRIVGKNKGEYKWKLKLRRYDPIQHVDDWWEETFDAVIIANGHYSVPIVPQVPGLNEYMKKYPGRVVHSKSYRTSESYSGQRVVVIGNSASGHDITTQLVESRKPQLPIYQSRRSKSLWDGPDTPPDIEWKPIIARFDAEADEIIFTDNTRLRNIDAVIYCTGYAPSFPFWNTEANGGPLYDYDDGHLKGIYQHTFFRSFSNTLGIIGMPRVLTFRSFEYQAIALARLFAGRNTKPLPPLAEQEAWEKKRLRLVKEEGRKFHDIIWDNGETMGWLRFLFELSGLPVLEGIGRTPPVLNKETRWAIEHVRKYPIPDRGKAGDDEAAVAEDGEWLVVNHWGRGKDSLHFI
ncbi:putative dimethylaniline monooxygenase [Lophiostoma macrostomum CBS 122681]|uniref:Putative dimethylaniline monooxygenase n=1 Tax=Lophiostoma macrostomum CBS 122681 TaxID=1314788 RepID=A0A6A6TIQ9_9PLEO|nr:putative dimethylaniline monooxygenase [Lophiostoma macrostomum CBS 122681]